MKKKQTMKFGFYRIKPEFISLIKEHDDNVPPADSNLYLGPVADLSSNITEMFGFVHVEDKMSLPDMAPGYRLINGYYGKLNLRKIIPCPMHAIISEDKSVPEKDVQFYTERESFIKEQVANILKSANVKTRNNA